jgi:hypothetical protein
MAGKIDLEKFNTDPKHAEHRETLDGMVEGAVKRLSEKKKKAKDPEASIFDDLAKSIGISGEE